MLTYTAEVLKALDIDRPPPRAVRKTLFTLRLWRPSRDRRTVHLNQPPPKVGQPSRPRSVDRSMSVAWLNAQSLRNKTDAVQQTTLFNRRSLNDHWTFWRCQRRGITAVMTCVCVSARQRATQLSTPHVHPAEAVALPSFIANISSVRFYRRQPAAHWRLSACDSSLPTARSSS